ncbi:MAG: DsbA family protein [Halobacteria archaeon]
MADDSRIERRKENLQEDEEEGSSFALYAGIAGVIVILAVVGYIFLQSGGSPDEADWSGVEPGDSKQPSLVSANSTGNDTVTVYYYGDFQCPHCKDFEEKIMPKIRKNYVKPGKAKFVFIALDFLNQASQNTAEASFWVWNNDRDRYWRFHRKLFEEQAKSNWAQPSQLAEYANDVNISNSDEIAKSVRNNEYLPNVTNNVNRAHDLNLRSTPSVVVNGTKAPGNDYERVSRLIDKNLDSD